MSQLQMRVAVLEQEINDKDQLMRRTKEVLEATQQQKVRAAANVFNHLKSQNNSMLQPNLNLCISYPNLMSRTMSCQP